MISDHVLYTHILAVTFVILFRASIYARGREREIQKQGQEYTNLVVRINLLGTQYEAFKFTGSSCVTLMPNYIKSCNVFFT